MLKQHDTLELRSLKQLKAVSFEMLAFAETGDWDAVLKCDNTRLQILKDASLQNKSLSANTETMLQTAVNQNNRPTDSTSTPVINDLKPIMKGLYPAFRDSETGEVHLSLDQDGTLALDHSFFNLPQHWIGERNR